LNRISKQETVKEVPASLGPMGASCFKAIANICVPVSALVSVA